VPDAPASIDSNWAGQGSGSVGVLLSQLTLESCVAVSQLRWCDGMVSGLAASGRCRADVSVNMTSCSCQSGSSMMGRG